MMRRLILSALTLIASTCAQTPLPVFAQDTIRLVTKFRIMQMDTVSRHMLAVAWDDSTADQNERGYCADVLADSTGPLVTYGVYHVQPAVMVGATPNSSGFDCAPGKVTLHTHPPATCTYGSNRQVTCERGGPLAFQCYPSFPDILLVWKRRDPLGLIQCDRHAIIAYYPTMQFSPNRTPSQGQ